MKKVKILIKLLLALIIIGCVLGIIYIRMQETEAPINSNTDPGNNPQDQLVVEQKEIQIFNGDERPIAVMIDNHIGAWPQSGLNKAYLVYEIIVEGGETRLMALFKGVDVENIGPVRSSRHYFLDYALENDAIYVHFGWSPQAESDITKYKVNNINGISESSTSFWRTNQKSAPHNVITSTSAIQKIAQRKGYEIKSSEESVLKYTADNVELEDGIDATEITIPHSNLQVVEYKYNEETKRYTRYAREKLQQDWKTGEEITTKNIIITLCDNYTLVDNESKGRQGLKNIGTFKGYYITNGKAIEITCTKNSRTSKTIYKDLNGKEINVNDGNTFINICPTDAKVEFK